MKLLYCTHCGDIIAPYRGDYKPRKCACERFTVWWRDGNKGLLSVFDRYGDNSGAWVLGITNSFLGAPKSAMTAAGIQAIIDRHPDSYMFKTQRTCIVRINPGESVDTKWENSIHTGPPEPEKP